MTDEEEEEIYRALAFADGEGQLSPGDHARLMASVNRLRAVAAAARRHVSLYTEDCPCPSCREDRASGLVAAVRALGTAPPAPQT